MPEFRIESNHLKYRTLSWSIVILLIAVAVFMFALDVQGRIPSSDAWLAVSAFLGGVLGICFLAVREAANYAKRQMIFVIDEQKIVRHRRGFPDVRISFSEIAALSETPGYLIVTSAVSPRRIAIPNSVSGYDTVRDELAKHHAISTSSSKVTPKGLIFPIASVLSWIAVVSVHDLRLVGSFAVIAVVLLAVASYHTWKLFSRVQKRSLAVFSLGAAWIAAILVIYSRVMHP